jgi:hypothetical protein
MSTFYVQHTGLLQFQETALATPLDKVKSLVLLLQQRPKVDPDNLKGVTA